MTRAFLTGASIPASYWVDGVYAAIYTINQLPTPIFHNKSPFQVLLKKLNDYNFPKPFECACFPNFVASSSNKLKLRSVKCVFLGYASNYRGYHCLDPKTGRVYTSPDVRFHEASFPYPTLCHLLSHVSKTSIVDPKDILILTFTSSTSHPTFSVSKDNPPPPIGYSPPLVSVASNPSLPLESSSKIPTSTSPSSYTLADHDNSPSPLVHGYSPPGVSPCALSFESTPHVSPSTSPVSAPMSSGPPPTNIHPMQTRFKSAIVKPKHFISLSTSLVEIEPTTFKQASQHSKWWEAVSEEYNALIVNDTWELVPSQPMQNLVGSKWFTGLSTNMMVLWRDPKHDWLPKVFTNRQVLITMRHSTSC